VFGNCLEYRWVSHVYKAEGASPSTKTLALLPMHLRMLALPHNVRSSPFFHASWGKLSLSHL
jgi:hypothetical protein